MWTCTHSNVNISNNYRITLFYSFHRHNENKNPVSLYWNWYICKRATLYIVKPFGTAYMHDFGILLLFLLQIKAIVERKKLTSSSMYLCVRVLVYVHVRTYVSKCVYLQPHFIANSLLSYQVARDFFFAVRFTLKYCEFVSTFKGIKFFSLHLYLQCMHKYVHFKSTIS